MRVLAARLGANENQGWAAFLPDGIRPRNVDPIAFATEEHKSSQSALEKPQSSLKPQYQPVGMPIAGQLWQLAQDPQGCREVQHTLDSATAEEVLALAKELQGHIWEATCCPHANHVLQKCLVLLQPSETHFILDELTQGGLIVRASQHKYGCRVVQKLLEHCQKEEVKVLVRILTAEANAIACHPYGNYVIQRLVTCCGSHQARLLREVLQGGIQSLGRDPYGCAVISSAMQSLPWDEKVELARGLAKDSQLLLQIACSRHGHQAAKAVAEVLSGQEQQSVIQLFTGSPTLVASRYGRVVASGLSSTGNPTLLASRHATTGFDGERERTNKSSAYTHEL